MFSKSQLARYIRSHVGAHLYDESGARPSGIAIYTLSDPRELRSVRYVGQTKSPNRRFIQHLNTARLWLLADSPWWVKDSKLRPLSAWIRDLYLEELRLPTMIICEWVNDTDTARVVERARIAACLEAHLQLSNIESERLGPQIQLL